MRLKAASSERRSTSIRLRAWRSAREAPILSRYRTEICQELLRLCSRTGALRLSDRPSNLVQHLPLERREQALAAGRWPHHDEADQLPAALAVLVQLVREVNALAGQRRRGHARKLLVLPLALRDESRLRPDPGLRRRRTFKLLSARRQRAFRAKRGENDRDQAGGGKRGPPWKRHRRSFHGQYRSDQRF